MSNFFPWEKWGRAAVLAVALEGVGPLEDPADRLLPSAGRDIFQPFGLIN
jgi:hypothetical protein